MSGPGLFDHYRDVPRASETTICAVRKVPPPVEARGTQREDRAESQPALDHGIVTDFETGGDAEGNEMRCAVGPDGWSAAALDIARRVG